ncbi:MAG: hypothetical protein FJ293_13910 [Planctomycetes bacterium]|nr:hypothetical protein [Planctomycetota bacterium]
MTGALRRVAALAWATARESSWVRALALALALLAAFAVTGIEVLPEVAAAPLRFERRLTLLCWLASGAALLAGAHAVGRDRRAGQLDAWRLSHARAGEILLGRALGAAAQVALAVAPLFAWLLVFDASGPCRQRDSLAPREQVSPVRVERGLVDGSRRAWRRGPVLLDPGERLELQFAALPAGEAELVLPWRGSLTPSSPPARFTLRLDGDPVVVGKGGEVTGFRLRRHWAQPPRIELALAPESGVVRVDLPAAMLRGPPRALAATFARLASGHVAELVLAALLGAALATAMAEGLALVLGGVLLLLCNLRALFVDAADVVREVHGHGWVDPALRAIAVAYERLVALLPDVTALRGVGRAARALPPWGAADGAAFLAASVASLLIALPAALLLARRPRGAR